MKPIVLVLLTLTAAVAGAQGPAEALLCDRYVANPGRSAEARVRLQAMARGDGATSSFAEGCLATAESRWAEAAKAFERAVKGNGASAASHYWLGRTYAVQAQNGNVLRQATLAGRIRSHLERAVALDPDFIDARAGLVQYYIRAPGMMGGSAARAHEQVEQIRRRNAYRGGIVAASVLRREHEYAAATAEYERLIAQYPDSAQPYSSLASSFGDQRRWDEAFGTIDRFLAALPREPLAQYAIGRAAAESGQQLERGEQGLRRYIAVAVPAPGEPTIATAHLRLGRILERRGQRAAARSEYETALRLEPTLEEAREGRDRVR